MDIFTSEYQRVSEVPFLIWATKRCEFLFLIWAAKDPRGLCKTSFVETCSWAAQRDDEGGGRNSSFSNRESFVTFVASCRWILEIHFFFNEKILPKKQLMWRLGYAGGRKKQKLHSSMGDYYNSLWGSTAPMTLLGNIGWCWPHAPPLARWKLTLCRGPGTSGYWGLPVQLVQVCFIRLKVYQMYINHDRNWKSWKTNFLKGTNLVLTSFFFHRVSAWSKEYNWHTQKYSLISVLLSWGF